MGRGLIIVLIASLAANIFAGGFFIGRLIHHERPPVTERDYPRIVENPFRLMRHAGALPKESRDAFRAALRSELPSLRTYRKGQRNVHERLALKLAADEWDRASIEKEFVALEKIQNQQRQAFNIAFLNAFEVLSAEDRQLLLKASREHKRPRHGRRGDRERRKHRYPSDDGDAPTPPPE